MYFFPIQVMPPQYTSPCYVSTGLFSTVSFEAGSLPASKPVCSCQSNHSGNSGPEHSLPPSNNPTVSLPPPAVLPSLYGLPVYLINSWSDQPRGTTVILSHAPGWWAGPLGSSDLQRKSKFYDGIPHLASICSLTSLCISKSSLRIGHSLSYLHAFVVRFLMSRMPFLTPSTEETLQTSFVTSRHYIQPLSSPHYFEYIFPT